MVIKYRLNYILQVFLEFVDKCNFLEWEKMVMDENIIIFYDNVGVCEWILKILILLVYMLVMFRFLILWYLVLFFVFWVICYWFIIFVIFLIVMVLFYIEEVGVLIEEFFWILLLLLISDGIVVVLDGLVVVYKMFLLLWRFYQFNKDYVVQIMFEILRFDGFCKSCDVGYVLLMRMNFIV